MEVVTEGQTTSEHTNKYEINLNVINDNGDDNDTYQNEGDDSDVVDDVTDAITQKSQNVRRFLRDKLSLLRLYRKLKILNS